MQMPGRIIAGPGIETLVGRLETILKAKGAEYGTKRAPAKNPPTMMPGTERHIALREPRALEQCLMPATRARLGHK